MELQDLQHPFVLRPLQPSDYHKGYLQLLGQLTTVGEVSQGAFTRRLEELQSLGEYHQTAVIEDLDMQLVVATATLLVELKIGRSCGKAGHIEDVVVDQTVRGQHLGQKVVTHLMRAAREAGCYKVILDCKKQNATFYEKCGFSEKEVQMVRYF